MFRPRPMLRIDLLLLQQELPRVTSALVKGGIFHLGRATDLPNLPSAGTSPQLAREDQLRQLELLLGTLVENLRIEPGPEKILEPEDLSSWQEWARTLLQELSVRGRRREELKILDKRVDGLIQFLEKITELVGNFSEILSSKFSFLVIGELSGSEFDSLFSPPPGIHYLILHGAADTTLIVFYGARSSRERLIGFLNDHQFRLLKLPARMKGDFRTCLEKAKSVRRRIHRDLKRLEQKDGRLVARHGAMICQRLHSIRIERSMLDIYRQCGFTDRVAMLGGWIPSNRLPLLEKILNDVCPGRFSLHQRAAAGADTPILFNNPGLIRPFERILKVYGTPSYGELEPTPVLALGFLVLFGMMFGDLGHGLVFILGGLLLRRASRFRDEGCILAEMGVFAALFGFLYGHVFGLEHLLPPLWFNPMDNIPAFMGAALVMGVGGILIGLALRVWNGARHPDGPFFTDPFGLAGLIFYGGTLSTGYLVYRDLLPGSTLAWLILPLAAIFLHPLALHGRLRDPRHGGIFFAEGAVEVLETILGFLANTFSFLRVAAFGLAHIGLMTAVFALAEQARGWPLGMIWMILVLVVGNLIVLVLEGLVVSIQTVRLEFYEIFSKFFQGGGVAYNPLNMDHLPERSR